MYLLVRTWVVCLGTWDTIPFPQTEMGHVPRPAQLLLAGTLRPELFAVDFGKRGRASEQDCPHFPLPWVEMGYVPRRSARK